MPCWDCKQFTFGQDHNSILDQVNTNPQIYYRFKYKQKFWDFQRTPDDNSVCGRGQFLQKRSTQDLICFSCKLGRTHCAQRRGWTQMYWTTVVIMQSVIRQSNSSRNTFSLQNSIINFYCMIVSPSDLRSKAKRCLDKRSKDLLHLIKETIKCFFTEVASKKY